MKLSRVKLISSDVHELNDHEQSSILGGFSGSSCCYWESPYDHGCKTSEAEAYFMGTTYWACNTQDVKERCHCG